MQLLEFVTQRGAQSALARSLGCQPQLVWQWSRKVRTVPADRCPAIERETAGAVTCEEQRPDVQWIRVADAEWPWHPLGRPCIDVTRSATAGAAEQPAESISGVHVDDGTGAIDFKLTDVGV